MSEELKAAAIAGIAAVLAALIAVSSTYVHESNKHSVAKRKLVIEEYRIANSDWQVRLLKTYIAALESLNESCPETANPETKVPEKTGLALTNTAALLNAWQNGPAPSEIPRTCADANQFYDDIRKRVIATLKVVP